jgi:hypothetical protein
MYGMKSVAILFVTRAFSHTGARIIEWEYEIQNPDY